MTPQAAPRAGSGEENLGAEGYCSDANVNKPLALGRPRRSEGKNERDGRKAGAEIRLSTGLERSTQFKVMSVEAVLRRLMCLVGVTGQDPPSAALVLPLSAPFPLSRPTNLSPPSSLAFYQPLLHEMRY